MEKLVKEFKKGNNSAFMTLVECIKKRLYVVARVRLKDEADVEDALQETFVKVLDNIHTLKDNTKFNSWITKILINECNIIIKNKMNKYSYEDINAEYYIEDKNEYSTLNSSLDFFSMINILSIEDRTIMAMYYTEEYTIKDISNILDMNENTVKSRVKRARDFMKKVYDKEMKQSG